MIAQTPKPPYYAVIFSSVRSDQDEGYKKMANHMEALAKDQPGYLGFESARNELGISVSYWKDLDAIRKWKANFEHQIAQKKGKKVWYNAYQIRIARVEREYGFQEK